MKSKRGSHVGVILSFVIFIAFLIFLYSILEPSIKISEDKQNLLDNLKIELTEKFSSELGVITFIGGEDTNLNCIRLENLIDELPNQKLIVKNSSGDIPVEVKEYGNNLLIYRSSIESIFFKIYHSDEFEELVHENIVPCRQVRDDEYSFESIKVSREIFYSKINNTKTEYENNYILLKEELNIPIGSEFSFVFTDKDEIATETINKNVSISVYAKEIPILYVDEEANINSGSLIIKVW